MPTKTLSDTERRWLMWLVGMAIEMPRVPEMPTPQPDAESWMRIFEEAVRHEVAGVIAETVAEMPDVPRAVRIQFATEAQKAASRAAEQRTAAEPLLELLERKGLRTLVLKGAGVAACYPRPELRMMSDLDLYPQGCYEEALQLIREEIGVTELELPVTRQHAEMHVGTLYVELHHELLNTFAASRYIRRCEAELEALAAEAPRRGMWDGMPIWLPAVSFDALFLLSHAATHFASRHLTLKLIADWALLLKAEHDCIDWPATQECYRSCHLATFAAELRHLAVEYLGADPAWMPAGEACRERQMLDDLFEYHKPETPWERLLHLQSAAWKYRMTGELRNLPRLLRGLRIRCRGEIT